MGIGMLRTAKKAAAIISVMFAAAVAHASNGELRVVGTGDGLQMLREIAAEYSKTEGRPDIVVPDSIGSGGGIAAVSAGTEKLARVARPLKETEIAAGLEYVPFARIPSVFIVNKSAGVSALTSEQIANIYSGEVNSWSEVGGNDVRVRVVRREDGDSTLQVLRASMPGWADLEITPRSKMAVTTQDAVETVRTVEGAIGFVPHSEAIHPETVVLSVDGRAPTDPGYPSAVEIAFVFRSAGADADIAAFIDFARSEEAARIISENGGIPITE